MSDSQREEIAKLEALFAANPEGRIFTHLAEAYRKAGELERAREVLERGLARHADYASAHVVLARVLWDEGSAAQAEEAFQRVLELDPHNMVALRTLGEIAAEAGRTGEALGYFRRLLAADPTNEDATRLVSELELWMTERESIASGELVNEADMDTRGFWRSGAVAGEASAEDFEVYEIPETPGEVDEAWSDEGGGEGGYRGGGTGGVVTETIGDVYAAQGLNDLAANVYRELLRSRPDDGRLLAKLRQVESASPPPAPSRTDVWPGDSAAAVPPPAGSRWQPDPEIAAFLAEQRDEPAEEEPAEEEAFEAWEEPAQEEAYPAAEEGWEAGWDTESPAPAEDWEAEPPPPEGGWDDQAAAAEDAWTTEGAAAPEAEWEEPYEGEVPAEEWPAAAAEEPWSGPSEPEEVPDEPAAYAAPEPAAAEFEPVTEDLFEPAEADAAAPPATSSDWVFELTEDRAHEAGWHKPGVPEGFVVDEAGAMWGGDYEPAASTAEPPPSPPAGPARPAAPPAFRGEAGEAPTIGEFFEALLQWPSPPPPGAAAESFAAPAGLDRDEWAPAEPIEPPPPLPLSPAPPPAPPAPALDDDVDALFGAPPAPSAAPAPSPPPPEAALIEEDEFDSLFGAPEDGVGVGAGEDLPFLDVEDLGGVPEHAAPAGAARAAGQALPFGAASPLDEPDPAEDGVRSEAQAGESDDDLEMFRAWLQSLKR